MATYYQGLTQDERQLLKNIFDELRLNHHSVQVTKLQEKIYFEVITRSVETLERDLDIEGKKTI